METNTALFETAFQKVRDYATNLGLVLKEVDRDEELIVVEDVERSIGHMVIDCEAPILEIRQAIMDVPAGTDARDLFERLLQMNEQLVHGAFALNADGTRVVFRDTLRLKTLDQAELEGTISAFELGMLEFGDELIALRRALD